MAEQKRLSVRGQMFKSKSELTKQIKSWGKTGFRESVPETERKQYVALALAAVTKMDLKEANSFASFAFEWRNTH